MEDQAIVALYWQRDESAIQETQQKYGPYLLKIAYQILSSREDSEESVNDTYLKAWGSMPPHRPVTLRTYLGKITRQLSIDLFRTRHRDKRGGSEYALSLTELEDCVSGGDATGRAMDQKLLAEAIAAYLGGLAPETRTAFLERYYFMDPVADIAARRGCTLAKTKSMLYRARQGLRNYLEKEGFDL